jgi:hypothetical protein
MTSLLTPTRRFNPLGPVAFLALGLALAVGLHSLRVSLAPPYDLEVLRINRFEAAAEELRCLSVGNSHSMSIDMEALGVPGYHVWSLGGDVFEVEAQLAQLLPRLPVLETVLMPLSYGSFHRDNGACDDPDRGMVRSLFYAKPPSYGMLPGDFSNYFKGRMRAGLVHEDHGRGLFFGLQRWWNDLPLYQPQYPDVLSTDGRIMDLSAGPRSHEALVKGAAEIVLPRHHRLQENMLGNNPDMAEDATACVERIIERLRAAELRIIFYTPPYYPAYTEGFDSATRQSMERIVLGLQRDHGIEYHDFSRDEAFMEHPEWFANCDHLNVEGARRFSRWRMRPAMESPPPAR